MEFREFEGRSVDEAIVQAMRAFRVSFEELEIQVITEASKGFLGMGGKSAKIKARLADNDSEELLEDNNELPEEVFLENNTVESDEPRIIEPELLESMKDVLQGIISRMELEYEVVLRSDGVLEISGDGSGLLIGKHGQTLDALQFIINRIANKNREGAVHITVDTEKYRQRHIDRLRMIAQKMGQKAKKTGKSVSLEKMNPYDRRIIHLALKSEQDLSTKSIGEGIFKKVVIQPRTRKRSR